MQRRSFNSKNWQFILAMLLSYLFGDSDIPTRTFSTLSACTAPTQSNEWASNR